MTGLERTLSFIKKGYYDHAPFHPIIMRWAAKYAGVRYRDFCTSPVAKCYAMIKCARDFGIDWVTVMSDIIDVDHLVQSMRDFAYLLSSLQVFSGKSDPVTIIQNGSADMIRQSVASDYMDCGGRCIVSAGCEITPGTTNENMILFSEVAESQGIN